MILGYQELGTKGDPNYRLKKIQANYRQKLAVERSTLIQGWFMVCVMVNRRDTSVHNSPRIRSLAEISHYLTGIVDCNVRE